MKTTIDIADPLLAEAKAVAGREHTTLKALVEEGLREILSRKAASGSFTLRDVRFVGGDGLTAEFAAKGGWARLHEAAYGIDEDEAG